MNNARSVYESNPSVCSHCGVGISFEKKFNKFCSHTCSAKHNNIKRAPRTQESKEKTSISVNKFNNLNPEKAKLVGLKLITTGNSILRELKCPICASLYVGPAGRKTCSTPCRLKMSSVNMSNWLKNNRSHLRGSGVPSYMEISFEQWLIDQGLTKGQTGFLTEVHFYNKTTKKNGYADFVFPRKKLIIELDGSHHKARAHLDDIRDAYLESRGWVVVRVTHTEYRKKSKEAMIRQLLGFPTII